MSQNTTIVGIAGASGAGKSLLTQKLSCSLKDELGPQVCSVISEDSYYLRRDELSFEQRQAINYDHPDAFEFDLLSNHLAELRSGNPIEVPQYDYAKHNRRDATREVLPTRIVILEGILIFHRPALRQLLDLKIFVDVPMDICLSRRIRRDTEDRGRSVDSVLSQYETSVRPMYFEFVQPTKRFADIIVPGGGENDSAVAVLNDHLSALCR